MGLGMFKKSAGRVSGTLGRFKMLQDYVLTMLKIEGEALPEGQDNQEIGDLAVFLAPFGIYPRQGCRGVEAKVVVGPTLARKGPPPDNQAQAAPKRNWVGERKTRVVLPLRKDSPSENQDL